MKKIVSLLLVALMLACSAAYAEGPDIDLASLSLDELVELHKAVDAEIDARIGCEPSTIDTGIYVVGVDIKAGAYTISYIEGGFTFQVYLFASMDDYNAFKDSNGDDTTYLQFQYSVNQSNSAYVSISDGMVMVINGTGAIEESNADWKP